MPLNYASVPTSLDAGLSDSLEKIPWSVIIELQGINNFMAQETFQNYFPNYSVTSNI